MSARARRTAVGVIAVSGLIHIVVLSLVGFSAPRAFWAPLDRSRSAIVTLVRPPFGERTKPTSAARRTHRASAPSRLPSAPPMVAPPSTPTLPFTPPRPTGGQGAGPGPAPNADDQGTQAMLKGLLGCDSGSDTRLTRDERARCALRFSGGTRPLDPLANLDPAKRAGFDRQAAIDAKKRAIREGLPPDLIVSCSSPEAANWAVRGANFGTGCLPDSAHSHVSIP